MKEGDARVEGHEAAGPAPIGSGSLPWGSLAIIFMSHFIVDSNSSFLPALLPVLREKFHLTLSSAGFLVFLVIASNSMTQPFSGIVVDRWPRLPWLAVGMVGSAVSMTAMGWLPTFGSVAVAMILGGALAGLCHPAMASRAGAASEVRKGFAVSVYVTGGRIGMALGPLMAIGVAIWFGMEWLWLFAVLALAVAAAVRWGLPDPGRKKIGSSLGGAEGLWESVRAVRWPLLTLVGLALCRTIVNRNILGFLPTLYVERGLGLWGGGAANGVMLLFGSLGVMAGGVLSDRFGRRRVIIAGIGWALFFLIAFLVAPPALGIFIIAVYGIGIYMPVGVIVALAQELLPGHRGFASTLPLGMTGFLASFSVLPLSATAERVGLLQAFWVLPIFLLVSFLLALLLPEEGRR